jgi:hypothetical protein
VRLRRAIRRVLEIGDVNDSRLILVLPLESTRSSGPPSGDHALCRIQERNRHALVSLTFQILFHGSEITRISDRSMEDVDGPSIAKSVYEDVFKGNSEYINPDDIAYALDAAVRRLRHEEEDPRRWATYVHLGI